MQKKKPFRSGYLKMSKFGELDGSKSAKDGGKILVCLI